MYIILMSSSIAPIADLALEILGSLQNADVVFSFALSVHSVSVTRTCGVDGKQSSG